MRQRSRNLYERIWEQYLVPGGTKEIFLRLLLLIFNAYGISLNRSSNKSRSDSASVESSHRSFLTPWGFNA